MQVCVKYLKPDGNVEQKYNRVTRAVYFRQEEQRNNSVNLEF